jgi:catechol 2,3-dioxygenase-like lactoylglutathione lyase family enzyme
MPALGAITLFVDDVSVASEWYQRVFDAPLVFSDEQSAVVQLANTMVNVLHRSAAPELVEPREVAGAGVGATAQYTVFVDDLAAVLADLDTRGVPLLNGPIDRPWGQRTATVVDPDGNVWEFAQPR